MAKSDENPSGIPTLSDSNKTVREPAREIPVIAETEVLVMRRPGGSSGGDCRRPTGARTMLVERYNHLGGLGQAPGIALLSTHALTGWEI
jgi:hypothetical protein